MDKRDMEFIERWAKKTICVTKLGGKCCKCGEKDIVTLTFHHGNIEKENTISQLLTFRLSRIESELEKCVVLCRNCHMKEHWVDNNANSKKIKKVMMEYMGCKGCSECGVDDEMLCIFDFHHINENQKDFKICGSCTSRKLDEDICKELDKCIVLCGNCHSRKHMVINRFLKFKDKIDNRVANYKEKQKPCYEKVKELFLSGMRQKDIASSIPCAKSTVCDIIKRYNLK